MNLAKAIADGARAWWAFRIRCHCYRLTSKVWEHILLDEATLLSILLPLFAHGMIIAGLQ